MVAELIRSMEEKNVVLVIGGGGREHAICWKLAQSAKVRFHDTENQNSSNFHSERKTKTQWVNETRFLAGQQVKQIFVSPGNVGIAEIDKVSLVKFENLKNNKVRI